MNRYERHLSRYRDVIPEFAGFLAAVASPSPVHLRVNTLRTQVDRVVARLAEHGVRTRAEPWCPFLLRLAEPPVRALGATLLHALGHVYLQSASSAAAAVALDARPGERVLDLCSAPGSKTTLIAQVMGDRGCVVANEPNRRRMQSLLANLDRLGITCAVVTGYSGQNLPLRHRYQRVLVDVPCSGEGTWRGPEARPQAVKPEFRSYLVRQQGALLRRAYEVLEPGGTLVYSTCTYAPEENEGVVGPFLEESDACLGALDAALGGEPGLTEWAGTSYPAELTLARRLYPHRFDSEGFFVARLVRP